MSPINSLLTALKFRQAPARHDLLGPQEFQAVLSTERARSDRSGWPFTLVVIKHVEPPADDRAVALLLSTLKERTRQIDTKGWYSGDLALILPYTHSENAHDLLHAIEDSYAKAVRRSAGAIGARPELEYTVYCYPPSLDRKVESV